MILKPSKAALILSGLLVLAGCSSSAPEFQYQCNDGQQFAASFTEDAEDAALIKANNGSVIELKQVRSASGARYLSDDHMLVLHTKGDEAILIVNEISQSTCRIKK
ncbi:MliC family protein [Vibrio rotiferianus]|uniref:MliC family protein n=1 Tax=Vibrio rotiferianus TaxID=190895 RepID=UPI001F0E4427|nr:MliC family protein [Vibrio rotiferianus]